MLLKQRAWGRLSGEHIRTVPCSYINVWRSSRLAVHSDTYRIREFLMPSSVTGVR